MNNYSSLQDAIKNTDRRLLESWDTLNYGELNEIPANTSQRCGDENEKIIAMPSKEDHDANIPFKMWAEIIPPERISRWNGKNSRINERVFSPRRSARQAVSKKIADELYHLLVSSASVSIGMDKR
jgi:hypothetical protein